MRTLRSIPTASSICVIVLLGAITNAATRAEPVSKPKHVSNRMPPRYRVTLMPENLINGYYDDALAPPFLGRHGEVVGTVEVESKLSKDKQDHARPYNRPAVWSHGRLRIYNFPPAAEQREEERTASPKAMDGKGSLFGSIGNTSSGAITVSYFNAAIWPHGSNSVRTPVKEPDRDYTYYASANLYGDAVGSAGPGTPLVPWNYRAKMKDPLKFDEVDFNRVIFYNHRTQRSETLGVGEGAAINDKGEIALNILVKGSPHVTLSDTHHIRHDRGRGHVNALNNKGIMVGLCGLIQTFNINENYLDHRATLWTRNGERRNLPALPNSHDSDAKAINDSGQIVGVMTVEIKGQKKWADHACLWQNGKVYDLNRLVKLKPGCVLETATSIDASGRILCIGTDGKYDQVFLLTPLHNR